MPNDPDLAFRNNSFEHLSVSGALALTVHSNPGHRPEAERSLASLQQRLDGRPSS
jgi:hypothetical protein